MKKFALALIVFGAWLASGLLGVVPQKWEVRSKDDFLKGRLEGVAVSYEGVLSLSPREEKIEGPTEDFYLSFLATADGTIFLGTGHGGKIYRMGKDGQPELYFQVPEMDIYCLAQDRKGNLYAGTSPNGKIYKITEKGKGDSFFNPDEKYIWDLVFTETGSLLAAVGESGGIYEINPQGEGNLLVKAEENHILCMWIRPDGEIIAGSGGGGLVYRIAKGRSSVVFESPFEEIKSIALDKEGNIYAAASGTPTKAKKEEAAPVSTKIAAEVTVTASALPAEPGGAVSLLQPKEPGALYKISPDGVAKRLWHSADELVFSLLWEESQKRILVGTGNRGRIYAVDEDGNISLLLQKSSEQVYHFFPAESKTFILANNPSHLSVLYPDQRTEGEYISHVLDTKILSAWGKIIWEADLPSAASLQFQTRSGNSFEPNKTWSDWSPPYQKMDEQMLSPKARCVQFKALFKTQSGKVSPQLHKVRLFYLQVNVPPLITRLELLAPNEVFLKPPEQEEVIWGIGKNPARQDVKKEEGKTLVIAKKVERKGYQTVIWEAEDENDDRLSSIISIRKEGESLWRVLEEKWTEALFAFDTLSFPDGIYFIRITVSDQPSNPPGTGLQTEKVSAPLTIDNSPPAIKNFAATKEKNSIEVAFLAEDSFSPIKEVQYLIRPDEWKVVFPTDGICDSRQESFRFRLTLPPNADNLITVKVKDGHENVAVWRHVF